MIVTQARAKKEVGPELFDFYRYNRRKPGILSNWRRSYRVSREDLAHRLGTNAKTIQSWELGLSYPTGKLKTRVTDLLELKTTPSYYSLADMIDLPELEKADRGPFITRGEEEDSERLDAFRRASAEASRTFQPCVGSTPVNSCLDCGEKCYGKRCNKCEFFEGPCLVCSPGKMIKEGVLVDIIGQGCDECDNGFVKLQEPEEEWWTEATYNWYQGFMEEGV